MNLYEQGDKPVNAQYIQHVVDALDALVTVRQLPYNPASDPRVRERVKAIWDAESKKQRHFVVQSTSLDIDSLQSIVKEGFRAPLVPWKVQLSVYLTIAFFTGLRSDEVTTDLQEFRTR